MPKPGKNLPVLERICVDSPCTQDWDAMHGNDEVRFCSHCRQSVHNLSAMTRERALELVARSQGRLCVRYVKRKDGSVATIDAAPPVARFRVSHWAAGSLLATMLSGGIAAPTFANAQSPPALKHLASQQTPNAPPRSAGASSLIIQATDESGAVIAGAEAEVQFSGNGSKRRGVTDESGAVRFDELLGGDYVVTIRSTGFTDFTMTVHVVESKVINVQATLVVSGSTMGELIVANSQTHDWVWHQTERSQILALESDPKMLENAEGIADQVSSSKEGGADSSTQTQPMEEGEESAASKDSAEGVSGEAQNVPQNPAALFQFIQETYYEDEALPPVQQALAAGVDPNFRDRFGDTPLMVACRNSSGARIVSALLKAGADPNAANMFGVTAPLYAALHGDADILKALIEAGVRLDAPDNDGRTALMIAVFDGQDEFVKTLMEHGANVNARDNAGKSVGAYLREAQSYESDGNEEKYRKIAKMLRQADAIDAP